MALEGPAGIGTAPDAAGAVAWAFLVQALLQLGPARTMGGWQPFVAWPAAILEAFVDPLLRVLPRRHGRPGSPVGDDRPRASMTLRFAVGTREYLRTLAPEPSRALRDALRRIESDPRHPELDLRMLRKQGPVRSYRARVLTYRIIYSPRADHTHVWSIQHRSEGYGWLDRLDPRS